MSKTCCCTPVVPAQETESLGPAYVTFQSSNNNYSGNNYNHNNVKMSSTSKSGCKTDILREEEQESFSWPNATEVLVHLRAICMKR